MRKSAVQSTSIYNFDELLRGLMHPVSPHYLLACVRDEIKFPHSGRRWKLKSSFYNCYSLNENSLRFCQSNLSVLYIIFKGIFLSLWSQALRKELLNFFYYFFVAAWKTLDSKAKLIKHLVLLRFLL